MELITRDPTVEHLDTIERVIFSKGGLISAAKLHINLRRRRGFMPFDKVGLRLITELIQQGNIRKTLYKTPKGGKKYYYEITEVGFRAIEAGSKTKKQVDEVRKKVLDNKMRLESGIEKLDE